MPLLLLAAPVQTETGFGTFVHLVRPAATTKSWLNSSPLSDRGHSLEHLLPYIGIAAGAAFFARRVFRFAAFRLPAFRFFVLRAAPRAPALRTVRFFARFFDFFFLAVIGM